MVSNNQPEWLPSDWKLQIKVTSCRKFKVYVHSKTSKKLYSKLAVLRHVKNQSVDNDSNEMKEHAEESFKKQEALTVVANDSTKDLPAGWTVEEKVRQTGATKGTTYKCFIDPSTGSKFYSKPEVFRYLRSIQNSAGPSRHEEGRSTRHSPKNVVAENTVDLKTPSTRRLSSRNKEVVVRNTLDSNTPGSRSIPSEKKEVVVESTLDSKTPAGMRLSSERKKEVVIETTVDKDLPSGWIKETRKKFNGTKVRTDPFYFHPAIGLVFRSKLEVLRYLETGEISRHAYRRRKSNVDKEDIAIEKTSPDSSVKRETTTRRNTRQELLPGDKSSKGTPSLIPGTGVAKEDFVRRITRSSSVFLGEKSSKGSPSFTPEAKVAKEDSVRRITRKSSSVFPGKESSQGSQSFTPVASVAKEISVRRITRSSSPVFPGEESSKGSPSLTPEAKVAKGITRSPSSLFRGEESSKGTPLLIPETKVAKQDTVRRITRSSSSKESQLIPEATVLKKDAIRRIPRSSSIARPAYIDEAKPDQSSVSEGNIKRKTKDQKMLPSTSSANKSTVESTVNASMKGCSNKKSQATKRKTSDQKTFTMPSRSSKRVARIDAHPVFVSIPIEHALRKKSIKDTSTTSIVKKKSPDADTQNDKNVPVCQPALYDTLHPPTVTVVPTQNVPVCQPARHDTLNATVAVLTQNVPVCQPARHYTLDASTVTVLSTQNVPVCQSARPDTLEASTVAVQSTQEEQRNTTDSYMENALHVFSKNEVIDVPPINLELSPINMELSSENPTDHTILEFQLDPLLESKAEKSFLSCPVPKNHSILDCQPDPPLGSKTERSLPGFPNTEKLPDSIGMGTEPSGSVFSFPPPLWSDPCLEFAYKTLTGAIPLDDNLAIEDYIQHQLRTTKQHDEFQNLPDIDMPSSLQKDEKTQAPPLPESTIKVPNSNGLTPRKTQQVKNW